ncbi:hypothetical protein Hs30E_09420 [Lactococcus hodotermopsidis]|uniref:Cystathionine beta-lyase n=1 Tax=Pseudolactococcus hodotermopsidis TaxID=2709157 RepID=A0A6A0BDF7_9LACT|nr:hypothetical protein [Lactococcus hodotermopsidis]GFH42391.1 hypothetical protein Hs30E_09420 [Lactococcus hodotermopsidis]
MDYVELAIKSGGFMAMDKTFLINRLDNLPDEREKLAYIMPPASVINAYFSEIYQKQGARAATDYFLSLSINFGNFSSHPSFELEGTAGHPTFRFIRLNLSGYSFGFCFENATETAIVFSEFETIISDTLLFEIAQLFPQYAVYEENSVIKLKKIDFGIFENVEELTTLTSKSDNTAYLKFFGYNVAEVLEIATKSGNRLQKMIQYEDKKLMIYIAK